MVEEAAATNAAAPVASFGMLDIFTVVLYLVVVTGVGLWMARGQKGNRDFFLGGRNLPWWMVGFSIVATETSALTFIGVPAYLFVSFVRENGGFSAESGNFFFQQLIIGYVLGRLIIAFFIVPYYFRGDVYTPYQLLSRAFGPPARTTASAIQLVAIALGAGVRVFVTAIPLTLVFQVFHPEWTITASIVLIMVAAMIYTSLGGIKAVVWTDMLQYFIFVGGGLFALFYIPSLITGANAAPDGSTGWAAIRQTADMSIINWGFAGEHLRGSGIGERLANIFTGDFNIIMGIFPQTLGIIFALGFDQLNVQRVLACKDAKEGAKAMILSALLIFPQFLLFLLVGAALFTFYQLNGFNFGLEPVNQHGAPSRDAIFPVFILTHVPVVLKGFLIAGILAAAMSSVSSALSAMGSMATMDLFRPLFGSAATPKAELMVARLITVGAGVALGVVAYLSMETTGVMDLAFTLAGLTGGGILGAFLYGLVFKRGSAVPVVCGMASSVFFMLAFNLSMRDPGNPFLGLPWPLYGSLPYINWPWHLTIGITVCLAVIFALRPFYNDHGSRDISRDEAAEG